LNQRFNHTRRIGDEAAADASHETQQHPGKTPDFCSNDICFVRAATKSDCRQFVVEGSYYVLPRMIEDGNAVYYAVGVYSQTG
jgi:hypothetical protein